MLRYLLAASLTVALASAAAAQGGRTTSVYHALDLDRCRVLSQVEEGASVEWRCPGRGAVPLFVSASDDRYDIDAGVANGAWESAGRFNAPGPRIEWRLRGGRPFAIIYRLSLSGAEQAPSSVLGVETIGRPGAPGCVIAWVDGRLPNANSLARSRADILAARFRCGRDQPEQHGPAQ